MKTIVRPWSNETENPRPHHGDGNELTIVKDPPHFGRMYDVEEIRTKVIVFLNQHLKP